MDKEGLVFRDCNANETVERLLNAITKVEPTEPAEDELKSDSSSNGDDGLPMPDIVIDDNGEEFKDYVKEEDKPPISPITALSYLRNFKYGYH